MRSIPGPNVGAMKKEQAAFAERLNAALATAAIDASPAELVKLLARHGGAPVTPQAVSGWLNGRHLPKQANMRALARIVGLQPSAGDDLGELLQQGLGHGDGRRRAFRLKVKLYIKRNQYFLCDRSPGLTSGP